MHETGLVTVGLSGALLTETGSCNTGLCEIQLTGTGIFGDGALPIESFLLFLENGFDGREQTGMSPLFTSPCFSLLTEGLIERGFVGVASFLL